jgi:hypothetical protein
MRSPCPRIAGALAVDGGLCGRLRAGAQSLTQMPKTAASPPETGTAIGTLNTGDPGINDRETKNFGENESCGGRSDGL